MSNDAIANYKSKLQQSKTQAEDGIRNGINSVTKEIHAAAQILRLNSQKVAIDVEEIVADLNTARDEWLSSVKGVFDTAITALTETLKKS